MMPPIAYLCRLSPMNHQGRCECGWSGKRRYIRGSAVLDVLDHIAATRHIPQWSALCTDPEASAYDPDAWGMGNPEH